MSSNPFPSLFPGSIFFFPCMRALFYPVSFKIAFFLPPFSSKHVQSLQFHPSSLQPPSLFLYEAWYLKVSSPPSPPLPFLRADSLHSPRNSHPLFPPPWSRRRLWVSSPFFFSAFFEFPLLSPPPPRKTTGWAPPPAVLKVPPLPLFFFLLFCIACRPRLFVCSFFLPFFQSQLRCSLSSPRNRRLLLGAKSNDFFFLSSLRIVNCFFPLLPGF